MNKAHFYFFRKELAHTRPPTFKLKAPKNTRNKRLIFQTVYIIFSVGTYQSKHRNGVSARFDFYGGKKLLSIVRTSIEKPFESYNRITKVSEMSKLSFK